MLDVPFTNMKRDGAKLLDDGRPGYEAFVAGMMQRSTVPLKRIAKVLGVDKNGAVSVLKEMQQAGTVLLHREMCSRTERPSLLLFPDLVADIEVTIRDDSRNRVPGKDGWKLGLGDQ